MTADGIIVKSFDLKCDESSLTGESEQLPKDSKHDPFVFSGMNENHRYFNNLCLYVFQWKKCNSRVICWRNV